MSQLLSLLRGRTPQSPAPVAPTDEIVPVHLFDGTTTLRGCILVWMFRFDEVLDPDKLHDSLSRVFQRDGWHRLGGRYKRRVRTPPISTMMVLMGD